MLASNNVNHEVKKIESEHCRGWDNSWRNKMGFKTRERGNKIWTHKTESKNEKNI